MKVFPLFILSLLIFAHLTYSLTSIKLDQHVSMQRLIKDPLLEISITESLLQPSDQANTTKNFEFFLLKSASRHKNKAYSKLMKNYDKLLHTLIQKLIIGDQRLFIKSKIKQKYIKKKRLWQFGIMFMIQGEPAELEECYHDIAQFGVVRMNSKPHMSALNERIIASNAFYKLKQKVWSELSRMPELTIQKVIKVQIRGFRIPNSISMEKKEDESSTEEIKKGRREEISYFSDFFFSKAEVPKQSKSVTIKAQFLIGEDLDLSVDEEESSESQFESESDENDSGSRKFKYEDE